MNKFDEKLVQKIKSFLENEKIILISSAILNAYFSEKPLAKDSMRQGGMEWSFVDDNRHLTPIARATIEHLLETDDDFRDSEIVKQAKEISKPKSEENLGDKAERLFRERVRRELVNSQPYIPESFKNLWQAFYLQDGRKVYIGMFPGDGSCYLSKEPIVQAEMEKLVNEGLAPTLEQVGLGKQSYPLTLVFPTAAARDAFQAEWLQKLGDKIVSAKKRILG